MPEVNSFQNLGMMIEKDLFPIQKEKDQKTEADQRMINKKGKVAAKQ